MSAANHCRERTIEVAPGRPLPACILRLIPAIPYSADVVEDNMQFYRDPGMVQVYKETRGWIDAGEEAALPAIAPLVRSKRVLDIGVGAGRTVSLLALLTDEYTGVDFSEEMVAACKEQHPDKDIRWGDARTLSDFGDGSFDFVFFSYNGIDTVDDDHRKDVFRAVHRVLDTDGIFMFGTYNKDGRLYAESPLQIHRPGQPWDRSLEAAARLLLRNGRDPSRLRRRYRNWRATRPQAIDSDGWGMDTLAHSDFKHIVHFTTLSRLREEVSAANFDIVQVYGSDTDHVPIGPDKQATTDRFLYVVARRSTRPA
jgi:SAM-dependent methyltransferase